MFCNHCGVAIPANARSCESCGHQVLGDVGVMEAKIKPPAGKRNDTLVTVGLSAIIMIIWFLLGILMHSEGNAIYYVLAGMALVGVGWWFWRRSKRLS